VLDEGPGTPALTSRHEGRELEPDRLRVDARAADVAAVVANPVAPLTPRLTARDLAAELKAPVVVAVRAEPALTGQARLYAEAMRAAGLPVAAVVIAEWPETPGRVVLDERVLLHEVTGLDVLTLSDGEAPDWPVDEWRDVAPTTGPAPVRVGLDPYRAWDGDVPGIRARRRGRGSWTRSWRSSRPRGRCSPRVPTRSTTGRRGGKKLTSVARAPLSNSVYHLAREGSIALTRADDIPWQNDDLVRMPDTPPVVVRELARASSSRSRSTRSPSSCAGCRPPATPTTSSARCWAPTVWCA
jgi:hypothetical protein